MSRLIVCLLLAAALMFPVTASAYKDWTGAYVPDADTREAYDSFYDTTVDQTPVSSGQPSDDEFPWMWLAIASSSVALGLAGLQMTRSRRFAAAPTDIKLVTRADERV